MSRDDIRDAYRWLNIDVWNRGTTHHRPKTPLGRASGGRSTSQGALAITVCFVSIAGSAIYRLVVRRVDGRGHMYLGDVRQFRGGLCVCLSMDWHKLTDDLHPEYEAYHAHYRLSR